MDAVGTPTSDVYCMSGWIAPPAPLSGLRHTASDQRPSVTGTNRRHPSGYSAPHPSLGEIFHSTPEHNMPETVEPLPELIAYQGAFGRHCTLAAQALTDPERPQSREAVRIAFMGHGDNLHLAELRAQRGIVNLAIADAKAALSISGVGEQAANKVLVALAVESRNAVESEWGSPVSDKWERLTLPVVNSVA